MKALFQKVSLELLQPLHVVLLVGQADPHVGLAPGLGAGEHILLLLCNCAIFQVICCEDYIWMEALAAEFDLVHKGPPLLHSALNELGGPSEIV